MPQGSLPERPVFTPEPVCVLVCWKKAGASGDAKATPPRVVIGPAPPYCPTSSHCTASGKTPVSDAATPAPPTR